jgi:hypothetical protein
MSWREQMICRVLLLVTRILAKAEGDTDLARELYHLSNRISVAKPEEMERVQSV